MDFEKTAGVELSTEQLLESDSDSSDSGESSDADKAVASSAVQRGPSEAFRGSEEEILSGRLIFHNAFKTIHMLRHDESDVMKCSRVMRAGYTKLRASDLSFSWPKCKTCFPP